MQSLPEIGDVLDETYELVSVLGTGGFGAVYRARQLNIDRDVALKMLVAGGPKFGEMVKRFRREVMAIRNLTHPNTVRIYDFRDNPDGLLYYTMEALDGKTLKEEVRESGPMSPRRLKHVLRQVLKSLSEAHAYNIVHRDLKPANIMLVDMHGETDFVKVLDFGIAKLLQDGGEDSEEIEELTSAGILVGTLRYMAPEQIGGDDVGPHTDLYALGLIAVEMLIGQSVFSGTGRWEVLQQQISDEPVAIPETVLASKIGAVIQGCLHKERASRFTSADEVLKLLGAIDDSALEQRPLYVSDGSGGWVPRGRGGSRSTATVPVDSTVEIEEIDDLLIEEVDDPFDAAKTQLASRQEAFGNRDSDPSEDKTLLTDAPFSSDGKKTVPMPAQPATTPQPSQGMGNANPFQTANRSGDTGEINAGPANQNARQEREVLGNQLQTAGVPTQPKSSDNKTMILVAVIAVIALGGGAAWIALSGDKDAEESEQDSVAEVSGEAEDPAENEEPPPEYAQDDEGSDEVEEELHRVHIDVSNSSVRATVFLDEELMGRTPYEVDIADGEQLQLRLEARGFEDIEATLGVDTDEEYVVELIEEAEEESDAVAERGGADDSGSGSAATGGARQDRGERQPTPTPRPQPEPVEEEPEENSWVDISRDEAEEEESSEGDDWVELGPRDEPEGEEEDDDDNDIPLF